MAHYIWQRVLARLVEARPELGSGIAYIKINSNGKLTPTANMEDCWPIIGAAVIKKAVGLALDEHGSTDAGLHPLLI